jgi:hypothetical protein
VVQVRDPQTRPDRGLHRHDDVDVRVLASMSSWKHTDIARFVSCTVAFGYASAPAEERAQIIDDLGGQLLATIRPEAGI